MNGKRSPLERPRGAHRPQSTWKIPVIVLKKAGVTCGVFVDTEFYGHDAVIKLRADFDSATTLVVRTSNAADLPVRDAQVSLEIRGGVVAWRDASE